MDFLLVSLLILFVRRGSHQKREERNKWKGKNVRMHYVPQSTMKGRLVRIVEEKPQVAEHLEFSRDFLKRKQGREKLSSHNSHNM